MLRFTICKICFLVLLIFLSSSPILKAEKGDTVLNGLRLETKMHYGSVIPHHSGVEYILDRNLLGAEVTLTTESNGRHVWEQLYRNPRYGVGYNYLNLGNPDVLGDMHAVFGLFDVPFYWSKKKFSLNYQVDVGLAYFTRKFDPYGNELNHVVSSPVTVYLGFDLVGRYKVGDKNELKTSIELTHCSNGKTRTPNLGLNFVTLSAAWMYSLKPAQPIRKQIVPEENNKHFIEFIGNLGGKRDDNLREEVFLTSSFIADYYYGYNLKYAVGAGGDVFYDASLSQHKVFSEGGTYGSSMNYQYGAHIGFRARYGRFGILVNLGHYLYYEYLRHGTIYTRVGMRYALTESILLNLSLKAHYAIADYVEWGIGYRIKTKGR